MDLSRLTATMMDILTFLKEAQVTVSGISASITEMGKHQRWK